MIRNGLSFLLASTLGATTLVSPVNGQSGTAAKIASAMAAGPASIAKDATIIDRSDASGKMAVLRRGTNGWTCMPSRLPSRFVKNDAMCMDASFSEFLAAMRAGKKPALKAMGIAYMLNGDMWVSNTSPSAKAPESGNQWHHVVGIMMLAFPERSALAGISPKPVPNAPYVMWGDTPFAHVMVPMK